jgi:hypothetical protein
MQEVGSRAGVFDICLSKEKENGEIVFLNVANCELKTTGKEMDKAVLFFNTDPYIGYKAEFRVMVDEGYELNAFHIRTNEVVDPIICSSLPAAIDVDNKNGLRSGNQEGFLFLDLTRLLNKLVVKLLNCTTRQKHL